MTKDDAYKLLQAHRAACATCAAARLACHFCLEGYRLWELAFGHNEDLPIDRRHS